MEHISAEKLAELGKAEYTKVEALLKKGPLTNKDRMAIPPL